MTKILRNCVLNNPHAAAGLHRRPVCRKSYMQHAFDEAAARLQHGDLFDALNILTTAYGDKTFARREREHAEGNKVSAETVKLQSIYLALQGAQNTIKFML